MRNRKMSVFSNYEDYKEEIELALIQNACVEIELYSIIASIIRESNNTCKLSVRDVSARRTSSVSKRFYGDGSFPDFVVLKREKNSNACIYGCIEAKRPVVLLDKEDEQLNGHIRVFHKVLYTNGIRWMMFEDSKENVLFDIKLGIMQSGKIEWNPQNCWDELLEKINTIQWY